jgi:hypothetical protein
MSELRMALDCKCGFDKIAVITTEADSTRSRSTDEVLVGIAGAVAN